MWTPGESLTARTSRGDRRGSYPRDRSDSGRGGFQENSRGGLRGGLQGGLRGRGYQNQMDRGGRLPSRAFTPNRGGIRRTTPAYIPSPEPPLGRLLLSWSSKDFNEGAKTYELQSVITGCKTVASYNWLERKAPTILVPGKLIRAKLRDSHLLAHGSRERNPVWYPAAESLQASPPDGHPSRSPESSSATTVNTSATLTRPISPSTPSSRPSSPLWR